MLYFKQIRSVVRINEKRRAVSAMLLRLALCALLTPACVGAAPGPLAPAPPAAHLTAPAKLPPQRETSSAASMPAAAAPAAAGDQHSWAGISNYYLWSCNETVRHEALDATRAAGLKVVRVFLVSTTGGGAVAACSDTPTPDLEPIAVGTYVRPAATPSSSHPARNISETSSSTG